MCLSGQMHIHRPNIIFALENHQDFLHRLDVYVLAHSHSLFLGEMHFERVRRDLLVPCKGHVYRKKLCDLFAGIVCVTKRLVCYATVSGFMYVHTSQMA